MRLGTPFANHSAPAGMFLSKTPMLQDREALVANASVSLLKCLKCDARLDDNQERCVCPRCGAEFPVVNGVPRFSESPTSYWGETSREEARKLLEAARKGPWAEAVRSHFEETDVALSVLDLQRASWATMLGFDKRSVALDIGSGYGAITHSLSHLVGKVYSVEAIPERIEFTQERLRQEGIRHVHLIQASVTALPLVENSFDLVVTNGILGGGADSDSGRDLRRAHLTFLRTICGLVKDDGVVVIGIENRFGWDLLRRAIEYLGLLYSSLSQRSLASFMLRHSSRVRRYPELNRKREYRTHISEQGCRMLLAEAGLPYVSSYWAVPSYEQPYSLIPVTMPLWIREHFLDLIDTPGNWPRQWRGRLLRAVASLRFMSRALPEFVLVASKMPGRRTTLQSCVEERLTQLSDRSNGCTGNSQSIEWELHTHSCSPKSIVRLGHPTSGRTLAYIKINVEDANSAAHQAVLESRVSIRASLGTAASRNIRVPQAYGTFSIGNVSYWMEAPALGKKLSNMFHTRDWSADAERVENDLTRLFPLVIELTELLQTVRAARAIDCSWHDIPTELEDRPRLRAAIEEARYFAVRSIDTCNKWIQHGDFSAENVFFDEGTGGIEVLDWDDLAAGLPPLYDIFHFFYSIAYLVPTDEKLNLHSAEERWIASFNALFFNKTEFARIARKLILQACERLKVTPGLIPSLLLEFLVLRVHYYRTKSVVQHRVHLRLLERYIQQGHPVFGEFHLRGNVRHACAGRFAG